MQVQLREPVPRGTVRLPQLGRSNDLTRSMLRHLRCLREGQSMGAPRGERLMRQRRHQWRSVEEELSKHSGDLMDRPGAEHGGGGRCRGRCGRDGWGGGRGRRWRQVRRHRTIIFKLQVIWEDWRNHLCSRLLLGSRPRRDLASHSGEITRGGPSVQSLVPPLRGPGAERSPSALLPTLISTLLLYPLPSPYL